MGHRIYSVSFASVYPHYVAKAEKKGRSKADVNRIVRWLTGYSQKALEARLKNKASFETFFAEAPAMNPARSLITGVVCGVRVENIEEKLMREIRYLDKLIDELAKGRAMEKILRTEEGTKAEKPDAGSAASRLIDGRIAELSGWRGETLALVRGLILKADPEIVEEWKWNVPVWSRNGLICTGEAYKNAVKLTFAKGASLKDPARLFNSSLSGNTRRAIDLPKGAKLDRKAFTALVREAVKLNTSKVQG